jgi:hypothetical protein
VNLDLKAPPPRVSGFTRSGRSGRSSTSSPSSAAGAACRTATRDRRQAPGPGSRSPRSATSPAVPRSDLRLVAERSAGV